MKKTLAVFCIAALVAGCSQIVDEVETIDPLMRDAILPLDPIPLDPDPELVNNEITFEITYHQMLDEYIIKPKLQKGAWTDLKITVNYEMNRGIDSRWYNSVMTIYEGGITTTGTIPATMVDIDRYTWSLNTATVGFYVSPTSDSKYRYKIVYPTFPPRPFPPIEM